jgi:hypothetical protein
MLCGMYVAALTIRAVRAKHLIQAKGSEPSTSAPNGVQMYGRACQMPTRSIRRSRTCPRGCLAREWAPWTRTPDEVTSRRRRERHSGRGPAPQVGCHERKARRQPRPSWDIIEKGVTMLTTQSPGCLRARPLEAQPERDCGLIWFVTDVRSGKEYDIEPSTMCAWSSSTPTPKPTSRRPVAAAAPACPALLHRGFRGAFNQTRSRRRMCRYRREPELA